MVKESWPSVAKIVTKVALIIAIPVILTYGISFIFPIPAFSLKNQQVVNYLQGFKGSAPLIYIVLQAATVLIVPIPSVILAMAAGVVFDFWHAVIYTTVAWIIGTSINFFIARMGGRPLMKKMMNNEELEKIDQFADKIGWKFIFVSWFIPGGTADVAGYAAGLSKMKYVKYFFPALTSAFLLSILTSAAGSTFKVSPILTGVFTLGAVVGILLGAKLILVGAFIKRLITRWQRK